MISALRPNPSRLYLYLAPNIWPSPLTTLWQSLILLTIISRVYLIYNNTKISTAASRAKCEVSQVSHWRNGQKDDPCSLRSCTVLQYIHDVWTILPHSIFRNPMNRPRVCQFIHKKRNIMLCSRTTTTTKDFKLEQDSSVSHNVHYGYTVYLLSSQTHLLLLQTNRGNCRAVGSTNTIAYKAVISKFTLERQIMETN